MKLLSYTGDTESLSLLQRWGVRSMQMVNILEVLSAGMSSIHTDMISYQKSEPLRVMDPFLSGNIELLVLRRLILHY